MYLGILLALFLFVSIALGFFVCVQVYTEITYRLEQLWAYLHRPPRPEPIASWASMALAQLDGGSLWIDGPRTLAREVLRNDWGIHSRGDWARECRELLAKPGSLSAWDGLRALRITMMARAARWVSDALVWDLAAVVAQELAHYRGFTPLAHAYHASYQDWLGRDADTQADELDCRADAIAQLDACGWEGVAFAGVPTRADAFFVDRAGALRALETLDDEATLARPVFAQQ